MISAGIGLVCVYCTGIGSVLDVVLVYMSCSVYCTGIGSIPDAVLRKLTNHRDLGIHTEMFSDGIINLVQLGVVTNARKAIQTGKIVGGFAFGTRALYDFIDNNPFVGESRTRHHTARQMCAHVVTQCEHSLMDTCVISAIVSQLQLQLHTHTLTHPFNVPFPGLPR